MTTGSGKSAGSALTSGFGGLEGGRTELRMQTAVIWRKVIGVRNEEVEDTRLLIIYKMCAGVTTALVAANGVARYDSIAIGGSAGIIDSSLLHFLTVGQEHDGGMSVLHHHSDIHRQQ